MYSGEAHTKFPWTLWYSKHPRSLVIDLTYYYFVPRSKKVRQIFPEFSNCILIPTPRPIKACRYMKKVILSYRLVAQVCMPQVCMWKLIFPYRGRFWRAGGGGCQDAVGKNPKSFFDLFGPRNKSYLTWKCQIKDFVLLGHPSVLVSL